MSLPFFSTPLLSFVCRHFDHVADDVVVYNFTLLNDGNVALRGVSISAATGILEDIICNSSGVPSVWEVGVAYECSGSHTVTQEEVEAGGFQHQATLHAARGFSEPLQLAAVVVNSVPSMQVTLSALSPVCNEPGQAGKTHASVIGSANV